MVKSLPEMWETWVQSLVRKILWSRAWQPTQVFLPGKSHGWRSLAGCSPWGCEDSDTTSLFTFKVWESCWEQFSCLIPQRFAPGEHRSEITCLTTGYLGVLASQPGIWTFVTTSVWFFREYACKYTVIIAWVGGGLMIFKKLNKVLCYWALWYLC